MAYGGGWRARWALRLGSVASQWHGGEAERLATLLPKQAYTAACLHHAAKLHPIYY
jgi:hypothetical protein